MDELKELEEMAKPMMEFLDEHCDDKWAIVVDSEGVRAVETQVNLPIKLDGDNQS